MQIHRFIALNVIIFLRIHKVLLTYISICYISFSSILCEYRDDWLEEIKETNNETILVTVHERNEMKCIVWT